MQSAEKSGYASYEQALCGIALTIFLKGVTANEQPKEKEHPPAGGRYPAI